jgi:hypothetical protein
LTLTIILAVWLHGEGCRQLERAIGQCLGWFKQASYSSGYQIHCENGLCLTIKLSTVVRMTLKTKRCAAALVFFAAYRKERF